MVKVVYRDGSFEIFPTNDFTHNSEHHMFFVAIAGCRLMIPDDAVRSIGKGRIEEIYKMNNGVSTKEKEIFVYE